MLFVANLRRRHSMLGHHGNLSGTVLACQQNLFRLRREAVVPLAVLLCPHLRQEVLISVLVEDQLGGRLATRCTGYDHGNQAVRLAVTSLDQDPVTANMKHAVMSSGEMGAANSKVEGHLHLKERGYLCLGVQRTETFPG